MNDFEAALLRLKGQVGETEDQAVAALLGLSKASFSDRKRRGSFPVDKLRALAQQRPDLNIDVDYVITGVAQAALEIIQAARQGNPLKKVSADESGLLADYRSCSPEDQEVVRQQAAFLASRARPGGLMPDGRYPKAEDEMPRAVHSPRKKTL